MNTSSNCVICLLKKENLFLKKEGKEDNGYLNEVMEVIDKNCNDQPPTWLLTRIQELRQKYFNTRDDYTEEKHKFNKLILNIEDILEKKIDESEDPIYEGLRYASIGNYIDFGVLADVSEEKLLNMIDEASKREIDRETYKLFKQDLTTAKSLAYLVDNCGEIVFDKLLVKQIRKHYPDIKVTIVVRGEDTINDATMVDAVEVGLDKICDCVGNGNGYPSTIMSETCEPTKTIINNADIIIAKGQGNFEGFYESNLNTYYMFLVKCDYFVRKFGMERFSTVFKREKDIVTYL